MLGNTDLDHNKGHSPIFEIKKELVYSYIFMCFLFFFLVF